MFTIGIIDSIIKQYSSTASFFSTAPEPIKTLQTILKKPDYINYQNFPENKLLQPEDLWELVSAWNENENLFSTYTYQGNWKLKAALRIFKALKNNNMLNKENMSIFYDQAKYEYLNNCLESPLYIAENPDGDLLLDFIVSQVNHYKTWSAPLHFLKKNNLLTLENLKKISDHTALISENIQKHKLTDSNEYRLPQLVKIIIEHPASAAILIDFYQQTKNDRHCTEKLKLIEKNKLIDKEAIFQLNNQAVDQMLFPDTYSEEIRDEAVITFITSNIKDYAIWEPIIIFLKKANILNISNLNKVGDNVKLISEAINIGTIHHILYDYYQRIFDLLVNDPAHAKIIYIRFRHIQYSSEIESVAALIPLCKNYGENDLRHLNTENCAFLNRLPDILKEFILSNIKNYEAWETITKQLISSKILNLDNLKAAKKAPGIIVQAIGRCEITRKSYTLLVENPQHAIDIANYLGNIREQATAVKYMSQLKPFNPAIIQYLTHENREILNNAPNEVVDFILARIDNHAKWDKIIKYLHAANILTIENLNKAESVFDDLHEAIFIIPPNAKLAHGSQKFYDLMIKNPKKCAGLFASYYRLASEHNTATVELIEVYQFFDEADFKYLTPVNINIIKSVHGDIRAFIIERIRDYEKWDNVIRYLFTANILTLENLNKTQQHLDLLDSITRNNKSKATSQNTHQNVFNFIIDNPKHALKVFSNPDSYDAIQSLTQARPNAREYILQNSEYATAAQNLITLLRAHDALVEGDEDFIINNLHAASHLYTCINILNASGLQDYYPIITELKEDFDQLSKLAFALERASSDQNCILGGKDVFEIIMQYLEQFSPILSALKVSDLVSEANINLVILNIDHIDNIKDALTLLPRSMLNQQTFENICAAGEYATHLARGFQELGAMLNNDNRALLIQYPRYALSIATAVKIADKYFEKYKPLMIEHPEHCDKLITGLLYLEKNSKDTVWPKLPAQYADTLAKAYVLLRSIEMSPEDANALINARPEYALDIANLMVKANNSKLLTPEFIDFIKQQAQHAKALEKMLDEINKRAIITKYNYTPLLIMSFDVEYKTILNHPLYNAFISQKENALITPQVFMTELAQLNCSFANYLLAKIFASYEFENTYHPNKAQVFLKKIFPGDPCYFMAQRLLFDILNSECFRLSSNQTQPELVEKYKQELNQVVRLLMENEEQGEMLKQMEDYSRTGQFTVNDKFIQLPEIALHTKSKDGKTCTISTQTALTWNDQIEKKISQNGSSSSSSATVTFETMNL